MDTEITIYVISDSIGETGESIARAAVRQFISRNYRIKKYPYVGDKSQVDKILEEAIIGKSMVVYTTVSKGIKDYIDFKCRQLNIPTFDVMTPPLKAIEQILGIEPKRESGIIRQLDDDYFKQIRAIEFAIRYDDGKDPKGIMDSDVCLIGISRTSKTPLSLYLAHKGFKVANVPLLPEVTPPKELYHKDNRRIVGLIVNSQLLNEIRQERLKFLGLTTKSDYASAERIHKELDYSIDLMKELDCLIIDVSKRAIGETANIINEHMISNFGQDLYL